MIKLAISFCVLFFAQVTWANTALLTPNSLRPINQNFSKGSYMAIDLPFYEYQNLKVHADSLAKVSLKSRGEAHLTVVTPPEYVKLDAAARTKIEKGIATLNWQESVIKPICIGKKSLSINGKLESTYYVVVEAPAIAKLRADVGLKTFYPHITLGFTKRDLHAEEGAIKDRSTCEMDVVVGG